MKIKNNLKPLVIKYKFNIELWSTANISILNSIAKTYRLYVWPAFSTTILNLTPILDILEGYEFHCGE